MNDKLGKPLAVDDTVVVSDNNKILICTVLKFYNDTYVIVKTPKNSMVTKHKGNIIKI